MIIRSYGLHWRREHFDHGWQGRRGTLMGRRADRVRAEAVDFRNQAGIYVLHDRFTPVYIGQAGRGNHKLFSRIKAHERDHLAERWDRFSWFGIFPIENDELVEIDIGGSISSTRRDILNHVEGVLLAVTEPPLNRQSGRFGKAQQFRQVIEEDPEEEEQ